MSAETDSKPEGSPAPEEHLTDDPAGEKGNPPDQLKPPPAAPAVLPDDEDWADGGTDELGKPPDLGGIDSGDESARIEILQADTSTPYHSANTFEELGLGESLMKGIYHMKFSKPSKIQATSLPMILAADGNYKNLIAQAHNGSGKTASFVLGMLSRVQFEKGVTQALCIVPTRELARQIQDVIMELGKYTGVTTRLAVKLTDDERKEERSLQTNSRYTEHIVVGTPGRVLDLVKRRRIDTSAIRILVLDEADEMIDIQGMGDQTIRIRKSLPRDVQVLLFSATYRDAVKGFAMRMAPDANQITVKRETLSLDKIQQYYIDAGNAEERFTILSEIYELLTLGQSIIFVRTRVDAAKLSSRMRDAGHTVSVLYGGDMTPDARDRVIDEFRNGTTRVLVTTNVLSRGVDVLAVSAVINYDLPTDRSGYAADAETYLHRIGRTGRFGRKGIAINFVYDDNSKRVLQELEQYYSKRITKVEDVEALSERIQSL